MARKGWKGMENQMKRVVITGIGAVTPVGIGVDAMWESIKAGVCGIDEITHFDTSDFDIKLAAEVKDFQAVDYGIAKKRGPPDGPVHPVRHGGRQPELMSDAGSRSRRWIPYRVGVMVSAAASAG